MLRTEEIYRKMKFPFKLLPLVLLAVLFIGASPLKAQTPPPNAGYAVSPSIFELSANPGDRLERSVRVDNLSDKPLEITVDRRNFAPLGEEGQAVLTEKDTSFSLASWISVTPDKVSIPAKESQVFNFTIAVPTNAEPGGHFGSVVFKTQAPPSTESGGVAVGQEIGSLILLKVAGDVREQAHIEGFTTKGFWEQGPITFESRLKNTGNVHFKPSATITISDMFGRKVATIPVEARNVLPDSVRKFSAEWEQKNLFGRYTATLSVTYGDKKQILTSTTSFTVIPYKPIGIILLILLIVGFLIFKGRRRLARSLRILFGKEN